MKVWITGSAGFLGSRLARALLACGHEVLGLSRRPASPPWPSYHVDLAAESARGRLGGLLREVGPPDVMIHAACRKPGTTRLSAYAESNVLATANLLDAVADSPPQKLVYTSTLSVYGAPERNPVRETDPCRGSSPYVVTKRCGEDLFRAIAGRSTVVILRLPSLYGAGQQDSFVDGLARLAAKGEPIELFARGEVVRDALHVTSAVDAIVASVSRPLAAPYCCINLGGGQPHTSREYAERLIKELGSDSRIVLDDRPSPQQQDLYADIRKAEQELGFRPPSLQESIRIYADELRSST